MIENSCKKIHNSIYKKKEKEYIDYGDRTFYVIWFKSRRTKRIKMVDIFNNKNMGENRYYYFREGGAYDYLYRRENMTSKEIYEELGIRDAEFYVRDNF